MNISLVSIPLIVTAVAVALVALLLFPMWQLRFSENNRILVLQNISVLVLVSSLMAGALGLVVNYPMQYFPNTNSVTYWLWAEKNKKIVVEDLKNSVGSPNKNLEIAGFKTSSTTGIPNDLEIKHTSGRNYLLQFTAPKSGIKKPVMVWLPRGYRKNDGKTYNVITFLHGYPGTIYGVSTAMEFDKNLQKAIDNHLIPPTIVVVPENNTRAGAPLCANAKGYPATTTFLAEDVPLLIKELYPNVTDQRSGWMVVGTSSGAYCAGRLAVVRGDVFGSVAMLSGYNPPKVGPWHYSNDSVYRQNTLTNMFTGERPWPLKIYAYSGYYDSDGAELNTQLKRVKWRGGDVLARVSSFAGGHNWATWATQVEPLMYWWGERIREDRWLLDEGAPVLKTIGPERLDATQIPLFSLMGWGSISIVGILAIILNGIVICRDPRLDKVTGTVKVSAFRIGFEKNIGFMLAALLSSILLVAMILNRSEQFFPSIWEFLDYIKSL